MNKQWTKNGLMYCAMLKQVQQLSEVLTRVLYINILFECTTKTKPNHTVPVLELLFVSWRFYGSEDKIAVMLSYLQKRWERDKKERMDKRKDRWDKMSHVMRKPVLPYANNKVADQPAHPHSLISAFVVHCLDSIIPLLAIAEISRL